MQVCPGRDTVELAQLFRAVSSRVYRQWIHGMVELFSQLYLRSVSPSLHALHLNIRYNYVLLRSPSLSTVTFRNPTVTTELLLSSSSSSSSSSCNICRTWWRTGWVDVFQPEGREFDSRYSRHVGTLGKFQVTCTYSCLRASAWNSDTVSVL